MKEQKSLVSLLLDNRVCVFLPQKNSVLTYNNVVILEEGQKFSADREHGWYIVPESKALQLMREYKQLNTVASRNEFFEILQEIEQENE